MIDIIERPLYLNRIKPFIGKTLIKVLTGQRRVGKSYLLKALQRTIEAGDEACNTIAIDKEKHEFEPIHDARDLIEYVQRIGSDHGKNAVFIDEVQEIHQFEKALRSLNSEGNYDIYVTGSNANLLSREISTILAGRCVEIRINALTYPEFLLFHQIEESDAALLKYLRYGGLPYLCHLPLEESVIVDYLKNIVQSILYRDVVSRHGIRNVRFLEQLMFYLADSVGSIVSAKKISDYLKSQRSPVSTKVVLEYLSHLTEACLLHKTSRYDIQGKRIFEVHDKYYFHDLGLRNAIAGYRPDDVNKVLENVVHHHLIAHGYSVFVGKLNQLEIDFIAEKDGMKRYYQVAYQLPDQKVIDREFGNLAAIPDNYPKAVITMDPMAIGEIDGIAHIHLRDFLTAS